MRYVHKIKSCFFGNRDVIYFCDDVEVETYGDDYK